MCATKPNRSSGATESVPAAATKAAGLRIEPVDNWHPAWEAVRASVEKHGRAKKLAVDADGWLSARQVLLVAFVGDTPAAQVSFGVRPSKTGCIEAKLDTHGIDPKFCDRGIESQLHGAVLERAQALRCEKLKGFRLSSKWC